MANFLNRFTKVLILILFASWSLSSQSQTAESILDKTLKFYNSKSAYTFTADFAVYPNYQSTKPSDKYEVFSVTKNTDRYVKLAHVEVLKSKTKAFKIDNKTKTINIIESTDEEQDFNNITNFKNYLKFFPKKRINSTNNTWICTLEMGKVSLIPIFKMILHVDKSTYQIVKQEVFLLNAKAAMFTENGMGTENMRMVVTYKNFTTQNLPLHLLKKDNYINEIAGKLIPAKKYNSYKIIP